MKNQKGFTLIELLLVLAIIGIISAIAVPALLSQRARARDKASISNMTGRMADLLGQYDKEKEAGTTQANTTIALQKYLTDSAANDKNPWNSANPAFGATCVSGATSTLADAAAVAGATATLGASVATTPGVVVFQIAYPATGVQGALIGAVGVKEDQVGPTAGTPVKYVAKAAAIE